MSQHEVACRHEIGLGEQEEEVGRGIAVEIALGLPAGQLLIVGEAQLAGSAGKGAVAGEMKGLVSRRGGIAVDPPEIDLVRAALERHDRVRRLDGRILDALVAKDVRARAARYRVGAEPADDEVGTAAAGQRIRAGAAEQAQVSKPAVGPMGSPVRTVAPIASAAWAARRKTACSSATIAATSSPFAAP